MTEEVVDDREMSGAGATLSIDAGTSLVKAVVFDERGSRLGIATTPTAGDRVTSKRATADAGGDG